MKESNKITLEEKVPFAGEVLVSDFQRSFNFYTEKLGFEARRIDSSKKFASLYFHGATFMIQEKEADEPRGSGAIFRFYMKSGLRQYYDQVVNEGAHITKPYQKMNYGLERFFVTDPDGYQLKFSQ